MREASFILPLRDNHGADAKAAHALCQTELTEAFGGFTLSKCVGAWRGDNGRVYRDSSYEYRVAADWDAASLQRLEAIALKAGRNASQFSVYLRHPDGSAFIRPVPQSQPEGVAA